MGTQGRAWLGGREERGHRGWGPRTGHGWGGREERGSQGWGPRTGHDWGGREESPSVGLCCPVEEGVVEGTGVREHELDCELHLLVLLVPAVDGHEQQLSVYSAAHDQEAASQAVQLRAGAAGAILHVQHKPLGILALQGAWLEQLLLFLGSNQLPVPILYLDLLDAHFDHCVCGGVDRGSAMRTVRLA